MKRPLDVSFTPSKKARSLKIDDKELELSWEWLQNNYAELPTVQMGYCCDPSLLGGAGEDYIASNTVIHPLDEMDVSAVNAIYDSNPTTKISSREFLGRLFSVPFVVELGGKTGKGIPVSENIQKLLNVQWMSWLKTVYAWLKTVGICPFYFTPIKRSTDTYPQWIPTTPPRDSGEILTFLDKKHTQKFIWRWYSNDNQNIEHVFFLVKNAPNLDGTLTSDIKSLVKEWSHIEVMSSLDKKATISNMIPSGYVEYSPDLEKALNGDEIDLQRTLQNANHVDYYAEGWHMDSKQFGDHNHRAQSAIARINEQRSDDAQDVRTGEIDVGIDRIFLPDGTGYLGRTPKRSKAEQEARIRWEQAYMFAQENPESRIAGAVKEVMDRKNFPKLSYLRPYEKFVPIPPAPIPSYDLPTAKERFQKMCGAAADYPIDLVLTTGVFGNAAEDKCERFIKERMRIETAFYIDLLRHVFLLAYGRFFRDFKEKGLQTLTDRGGPQIANQKRAFLDGLDVDVYFNRYPDVDYQTLVELHRIGFLSAESVGEGLSKMFNLRMDENGLSVLSSKLEKGMEKSDEVKKTDNDEEESEEKDPEKSKEADEKRKDEKRKDESQEESEEKESDEKSKLKKTEKQKQSKKQ